MKKYFLLPFIVVAAIACNKTAAPEVGPKEIVLNVGDGFNAVVETKATAVTTVPSSLYWGASTGTAGSEVSKWAAATATVSSNKINTGKYQTKTPTTYNFYVANQNFSIAAAKTTMTVANNNTDVIAARVSSSSTTPAIQLGHIFARTGSLTCNTVTGYTISGVSWTIVGKGDVNGTAGTFNLTTNSWDSASTKLSSDTPITSSSDMYLIPGSYTIKVTYTLTKGDWTDTFTKSADVTLQQGKVNNISGTAVLGEGDGATEIVLNVSVAAWGTNNINGLSF